MEHQLTNTLLFWTLFLAGIGLLTALSKRWNFIPYTVILLVAGAIGQLVVRTQHIPIHADISSDFIYFVLLPVLLFESAFHINFHQFRLQFKTITFIATFGLLVSIFAIAVVLSALAGLPFSLAVLFGSIISATDPIAVISLFKHLGAPKRLALVADGESMFNDATGVIAFRIVSVVALGTSALTPQSIATSMASFALIFIGSILLGGLIGYLVASVIARIRNDQIIETTMTIVAAFGSFIAAEHFFHVSGVITTVVVGIVVGHFGRTKFSPGVRHFVEEFWEYFAFLSVSLVFFFSTFKLSFDIFLKNTHLIGIAILAVLIGRAVSVYISAFITNTTKPFRNEPNIPLSWQHILNWGGLRGVIPLVLVYSLPESYMYRDLLISFTMGSFLFTLFVNGLTISPLMKLLNLHKPEKDKGIIDHANAIFEIEEDLKVIKKADYEDFDHEIIKSIQTELRDEKIKQRQELLAEAPGDILHALEMFSLTVERNELHELFNRGIIGEHALFEFEAELDLQQDALEHPSIFPTRIIDSEGFIHAQESFRTTLLRVRSFGTKFPLLSRLMRINMEDLVHTRIEVLHARIRTSEKAVLYLKKLYPLIEKSSPVTKLITNLVAKHSKFTKTNQDKLERLSRDYPIISRRVQKRQLVSLLEIQ